MGITGLRGGRRLARRISGILLQRRQAVAGECFAQSLATEDSQDRVQERVRLRRGRIAGNQAAGRRFIRRYSAGDGGQCGQGRQLAGDRRGQRNRKPAITAARATDKSQRAGVEMTQAGERRESWPSSFTTSRSKFKASRRATTATGNKSLPLRNSPRRRRSNVYWSGNRNAMRGSSRTKTS